MDNLQILFAVPSLAVQLAIDGILIGAILALAAFGMALVWGVMNIINIAQGEFVIMGGYATLTLTSLGLPPLLTLPLAPVIMFVVGWIIYRIVIFRVVDRDLFISILAPFGISILLQQLINQIWGADIQSVQSGLTTRFFFDDAIRLPEIRMLSVGIVIALGIGLAIFLKSTRMGRAIRATAQNPRAARIMGVDTDKVYATTYALNAAICGAAGSLIVMTLVIGPFTGIVYTVRSFLIVIVAGLGNIPAVIVAAFGLGAAENYAGFILGSEFQVAFVFGLLVVIIVGRNLLLSRQRKYLK